MSVAALESRKWTAVRKDKVWNDNHEESKRFVRFLRRPDLTQKERYDSENAQMVVKVGRSVEYLKANIDRERQEMDRLENHGSAPMASYNCGQRIAALQRELKDSHGVDY